MGWIESVTDEVSGEGEEKERKLILKNAEKYRNRQKKKIFRT